MRCDAYFRAWNRKPSRIFEPRNVRVVIFEAPEAVSVDELLALARAAGAAKDPGRCGIFQIQTDAGIWTASDGRTIRTSSPGLRARVRFHSWEALEAAELGAAA
jgi:hypothetical protein